MGLQPTPSRILAVGLILKGRGYTPPAPLPSLWPLAFRRGGLYNPALPPSPPPPLQLLDAGGGQTYNKLFQTIQDYPDYHILSRPTQTFPDFRRLSLTVIDYAGNPTLSQTIRDYSSASATPLW